MPKKPHVGIDEEIRFELNQLQFELSRLPRVEFLELFNDAEGLTSFSSKDVISLGLKQIRKKLENRGSKCDKKTW